MAFVWTVSLNYGSILMPTVLTIIILILFLFNYLEEHAIRYSLSDLIHLKHENNSDKTDKNETKVQTLESCDSNPSKINYFNSPQNYYIDTIDEHNEEYYEESSSRRSQTCSKRSMTDTKHN